MMSYTIKTNHLWVFHTCALSILLPYFWWSWSCSKSGRGWSWSCLEMELKRTSLTFIATCQMFFWSCYPSQYQSFRSSRRGDLISLSWGSKMLETPIFRNKFNVAGTFTNLENVFRWYLRGIFPPITCSTLVLAKEVPMSALNAGRGSNFEMGRHLRVDRGQNFSRSGMRRQLFLLHLSDAAVGFSVTLSGIQFNPMHCIGGAS